MAKLTKEVPIGFEQVEKEIIEKVYMASDTAQVVEKDLIEIGGKRVLVATLDRYAAVGDSRVSMTIIISEISETSCLVTAHASGGSNAILLKINKWSDDAFLKTLSKVLEKYDN